MRMRNLFWLALLVVLMTWCGTPAKAQPSGPSFRYTNVDPAGSCNNGTQNRYNWTNNKEWGCNNGTWVVVASGGAGTVTSITLAGTAGQITVTGTCTVTTTGTCTFSLPSNVVLPGTINSLTLTTSTGTITLANGKTFTINAGLTLAGTDGVTVTFPASNATVATLGLTNTFTGTQDASAAPHTLPMKVVANTGALPATCTVGELAIVTAATLGQQIYQCSAGNVWTQQLNSGTATGGGITMYSATGLTVTANTYYIPLGGGGSISTTEANVDIDSPAAATITNMYVQLSVALGVGNTGVFTMRKAGVSQSVTCTISGASATSCSDTTHSFNVSQGDLLAIQLVTTGTIVVTPNILIAAQFGNITATGTVNTGTINQLAYFAANGSAVSGTTAAPNGTTATTQATGDSSTQLANDAYVSNALASINPAVAVQAATTAVLSNTPTYANGTAGVGATLTAGSNGALTIDGYTVLLNDRVLVKNQAAALQNGVYTETTLGTAGVAYVLTRATDYNSTTNINYTGTIPVLQGTTNANTGWNLTTQITTVGTDSLNYTQAAAGSASGPPGGNVKAQGGLTNGQVAVGQGGKTIATTGVVAANLVTASSPGAGVAHFAGSTQAVTSSSVVSSDLNITTTSCTAPAFLNAISSTGVGTCVTPVLTQNSQSAAYTTVLGDAGKMILHPAADNNARTFTIDSNANVAYPTGTCITFVNMINTVTIAITSDTMTLMGSNTTGSRTLAVGNWATACKIASTSWVIGGSSGLT